MPSSAVPPIPSWLADRPTAGGLVVPWVTPRTVDGRQVFGVVDRARMETALRRRWCGVCGRPLNRPLVLLMRLSDLPRQCTNEPALHPQCAAYTTQACPMVAGRLDHYRTSPPSLGPSMIAAPDTKTRLGAPAEPWFAVWLPSYRLTTNHGHLVASFAGIQVLRIRPVNDPTRPA